MIGEFLHKQPGNVSCHVAPGPLGPSEPAPRPSRGCGQDPRACGPRAEFVVDVGLRVAPGMVCAFPLFAAVSMKGPGRVEAPGRCARYVDRVLGPATEGGGGVA